MKTPITPSPITPSPNSAAADDDLDEQARPGHGVPSQDPDPAAQVQLAPHEARREAQSVRQHIQDRSGV